MRRASISRLQKAMRDHNLDALVAISPENFAYVTGFVVPTQPFMRWRHAAAVVTADGAISLVCVDMEETTVRKLAPDLPLAVWGEFDGDAMRTLADTLASLNLDTAKVGVELDYLPARDHAKLSSYVPRVAFVGAEAIFARLRQIKEPAEIEILRRVSRISDKSISDAFHSVGPGKTEMDIASALYNGVTAQKADQLRLMIVATGERSELPNVGPSERVLKIGDVCRVEIFTQIEGYLAGVCRTAVIGAAPPQAERIYANLVACKHLLLDMIAPGVSSRNVYEVFTAKLKELDMPPIGFIGHGIGLHLHEDPYLGPYGDVPLEAGMVLGVEPLVYRTGYGFGMQLKDMVLVTEKGCELLSDVSETDDLLIVGGR